MSERLKSLIADKNSAENKRALLLAGGGVRLAYQAGVLQALQEVGLQFSHIDGTSGGIFNTAMLASGLSPAEMCERWRKAKIMHFMSYRPAKEYFKMLKMVAFGDADGIRNKIFPQLGIDIKKINSNGHISATFNVCNFSDKSIESLPHTDVTEDHLIAGVSLPIFMPAIKIKNDWYSDAVWIKDANLMEAVKRGAEELWLVWAIGNNRNYLPGSFNQYVHMIEMSANGTLLEEYAQIRFLNERIEKGDSPYGQKKPIKLFVIKPEFPLPLDPDLFLDKINTDTLINTGYADARKYLSQIPFREIALDKESTKMNDPGVTLNFRQNFSSTLNVGDQKRLVTFSPSFNLRKWGDKFQLFHQSGIEIQGLGEKVSTRNNQSFVRKDGDKSFIEISSEFDMNGDSYLLKGTLPMSAIADWILGLEFKKIKLSVTNKKSGSQLVDGYLTQDISNRIKNLFSAGLRNYHGNGINIKEKYSMISNLYKNEI